MQLPPSMQQHHTLGQPGSSHVHGMYAPGPGQPPTHSDIRLGGAYSQPPSPHPTSQPSPSQPAASSTPAKTTSTKTPSKALGKVLNPTIGTAISLKRALQLGRFQRVALEKRFSEAPDAWLQAALTIQHRVRLLLGTSYIDSGGDTDDNEGDNNVSNADMCRMLLEGMQQLQLSNASMTASKPDKVKALPPKEELEAARRLGKLEPATIFQFFAAVAAAGRAHNTGHDTIMRIFFDGPTWKNDLL